MGEKEVEGARTKCVPRKSKGLSSEGSNNSQAGSKRFEVQVQQLQNGAA